MHTPAGVVPGKWWHRTNDGRFHCDLCPRGCTLQAGQRGFCYVRQATIDGIVLTTYGRSSGFCVDPIEKKPLNHFLPGTSILSFGTAGCNLGCKFCQNWDISKSKNMDRLADSATPEDLARVAKKLDCRSVAFTYNDPVIFAEYAIDTARACRKLGIHPVAVSAGYIAPEARPEFFDAIDAANIDLKAFTDEFYRTQCMAQLEPVLDTLKFVARKTKVWLELTTLLIPGLNDSPAELSAMTKWIFNELGADVPLHFSAFHPDFKMLEIGATPPTTLTLAREIAMENGLHYVYTGNIHDPKGASTFCPQCRVLLIERDWFDILSYRIRDGKCPACGLKIAGLFENSPGAWGAKRMPVRISA